MNVRPGRSATSRLAGLARLPIDLVAAALVLLLLLPVWLLPWDAALRLGRAYGLVAFLCWPKARRVGMINLRRAYGSSMSKPQARRATRAVVQNLAQSIAEAVQFARRYRRGQAGWEALYEPGDAQTEARILADPRPKIFVTAHLGAWEMAAGLVRLRMGNRGAGVARRIDNPFLNAVVRWARLSRSAQWIEKAGATSEALRRLRAGDSVALLVDENAGYRGVFVDFFGRPASTSKTPALLALLTGCPIVVGAALRQGHRQKLRFKLEVIEPPPDAGPAAIAALTQQIAGVCERWVREAPLQWRWVHWRWKTRPDGSEERYTRADLDRAFDGPGRAPIERAEARPA